MVDFFKFEEKSKVVPLPKFTNLKIFDVIVSRFDLLFEVRILLRKCVEIVCLAVVLACSVA